MASRQPYGAFAASNDRRWVAVRALRESRVPPTDRAGVIESRARELEAQGARIGALPDVVPLEHELAEVDVPVSGIGRQLTVLEPLGRGVSEGVEGGAVVLRVASPPADLDPLGVAPVAGDDIVARR